MIRFKWLNFFLYYSYFWVFFILRENLFNRVVVNIGGNIYKFWFFLVYELGLVLVGL